MQDDVPVDREPVRLPHRDSADLAADNRVVRDREVLEEGGPASAHVGFVIGQVDAMARPVMGVDRVAADRDVAQRRASIIVELHAIRVLAPAGRVQTDVIVREERVVHPSDNHGVPGRVRDTVSRDGQPGDRGKLDRRREAGDMVVLQGEVVGVVYENAYSTLRRRSADVGILDGDARRTSDHDALGDTGELKVDPVERQVRRISELDAGEGHLRSVRRGDHRVVEVTPLCGEVVGTALELKDGVGLADFRAEASCELLEIRTVGIHLPPFTKSGMIGRDCVSASDLEAHGYQTPKRR